MLYKKSLSLSYAPRPPAQAQTQSRAPTSISQVLSRSPPSRPSPPSKKATPRGKQKTSQSVHVPGPEIPLPDPNKPVPPHFFRNQSALLGNAGIVGGIKVAELPSIVGASASKPIVISENTPEPAPVASPSRIYQPSFLTTTTPYALSLPHPCPPHAAILKAISQRKEVIPILREILKIISSGYLSSAFKRRTPHHDNPDVPSKKRKLNHVPAGAVDWDVPFPFKAGDGPDDYLEDWSRQRFMGLISKLTTLIRDAAFAAAAQINGQDPSKFSMEARHPTLAEGHYYLKAPSSSSNLSGHDSRRATSPVLSDHSNNAWSAGSLPFHGQQMETLTPESLGSLDQLLSSLLATSNEVDNSSPGTLKSHHSESPTDAGMFENWLNILQTLPPPEDIFLPFPDNDLGVSSNIDPFAHPLAHPLAHLAPEATSSLPPDIPMQDSHIQQQRSYEFAIDPELLALSAPTNQTNQPPLLCGTNMSMNPWDSGPFSLASPIPSMGSFTETEPLTPVSAGWDLALPETFSSQSSVAGDSVLDYNLRRLERTDSLQDSSGKDSNKGKSVKPPGSVYVNSGRSTPASTHTRGSTPATTTAKPSRIEILKAARERRQELAKALVDSTMAIWETTIEQGVLSHLAQYYRDT